MRQRAEVQALLRPVTSEPALAKTTAAELDATAIGALVALVNGRQLQIAEQRARELLGAHPQVAMLWKILSVAQMRQGKDALAALRRASELAPDDAEAQGNLGTYLCDRGQWGMALPSLRRALGLQPNNEELLLATANALLAIGQARESVALFQQALQLNPQLRGGAQQSRQRPPDAG